MVVVFVVMSLLSPILALSALTAYFLRERRALPCSLGLAVIMAIIGAGYIATEGDLISYIPYVARYGSISLAQAFGLAYGDLPVTTLWFWLVGHSGSEKLLQCSAIFVNYLCLGYILFDYCARKNYNGMQVVATIIIAFCLFPIFGTTSAVRSTPALALGFLGVYLNLYKEVRPSKVLSWILMIVPIGIHAVGVLPLIVFVLARVSRGRFIVLPFVLGLAIIPVLLAASPSISPYLFSGGASLIDKLAGYVDWGTSWSSTVAASGYFRMIKILNILLCVFVFADCFYDEHLRTKGKAGVEEFGDPLLVCVVVILSGLVIGFAVFITVPSYLRISYALAPFLALYAGYRLFGSSRRRIQGMMPSLTGARSSLGTAVMSWVHFVPYALVPLALGLLYTYYARTNTDLAFLAYTLLAGVFPQLIA